MTSTINVDVQPGKGAGSSFLLGMPIRAAIFSVQRLFKSIKTADLVYDDKDYVNSDLILHLPSQGMVLSFEPISQRLFSIEITKFSSLTVSHNGKVFSEPGDLAYLPRVYKIFGPTTMGKFDEESNEYALSYEGICFYFRIPHGDGGSKVQEMKQFSNNLEIPHQFADGSHPILARVQIHRHSASGVALLPIISHFAEYWEPVKAIVGAGIVLPRRNIGFTFGASAQEVADVLGIPSNIHVKHPDAKKSPLTPAVPVHSATEGPDYFFNYFSMGLDIMFNGGTNRAEKIFLHTNAPGHEDFATYQKCNFTVYIPQDTRDLLALCCNSRGCAQSNTRITMDQLQKAFNSNGKVWSESLQLYYRELRVNLNKAKVDRTEEELNPISDEGMIPVQLDDDDEEDFCYRNDRSSHGMKNVDQDIPKIRHCRVDNLSTLLIPVDAKWSEAAHLLGDPGQPVIHSSSQKDTPFPSTRIFVYSRIAFEVMKNDRLVSVQLS